MPTAFRLHTNTDSVAWDYEKLPGTGVEIKSSATDAGGVQIASFDDTCGSWIQLVQE